jgi:hypothetical protein
VKKDAYWKLVDKTKEDGCITRTYEHSVPDGVLVRVLTVSIYNAEFSERIIHVRVPVTLSMR